MALLNDLRVLGTLLPPSERAQASEVADIVSALVAHVEHGHAISDAVAHGSQGVHDFYHEVIAKYARESGLPEPVKGSPVVPAPAIGAPAPVQGPTGVDPARIAKIEALLEQLIAQQPASEPEQPVVG